jgi:cytochrome c peroxidase
MRAGWSPPAAVMMALLSGSTLAATAAPLGLPPVPIPADNPQTPAKIALGSALFNDTRFSADRKVSCATCHNPAMAYTDSLPVSKGFNDLDRVNRHTPVHHESPRSGYAGLG